MTRNEIPGTFYGLSDSGWMDAELFEEWFMSHFLLHAPAVCPLLLLLDGHSSHYSPSLLRKAADEGVIIFCLPPHMNTPATAFSQWSFCLTEEPLASGVPTFLHVEPRQGPESPKLHVSFPHGLGSWHGPR